jgi:plastocyanin
MRLRLLALPAGFLAALVVAGMPASAADSSIAANGTSWNPGQVSIVPGDTVTWSNPAGGTHNVCVAQPGSDPSVVCDEFRNGDPAASWASYANAHTFATAGEYKFICQFHGSFMSGKVIVGGSGTTTTGTGTGTNTGTGTGTSTTPPPDTQPTDTITTPTGTAPAVDRTAPAFTNKPKRKSSRKSLILSFGSSEAGKLEATVTRRAPGARSFTRVGQASLKVKQGRNTVTLPRKAAGSLRRGAYRVKLVLVDAAGNRSSSRTLAFKL